MNTFENTRTAAQFFQKQMAERLIRVSPAVETTKDMDDETLTELRLLAEDLSKFNAFVHAVEVADAQKKRR
jgi:hypothetical protein